MKTIYCYGDSNTWGYDPRSVFGGRYPKNIRWTGMVEARSGCKVINDGMNGREIPVHKQQLSTLVRRLEEHQETGEITYLWVMLGSNDLLNHPAGGAEYAATKMELFFEELTHLSLIKPDHNVMLRLISPPVFRLGAWVESDALVEQSQMLGKLMQDVSLRYKIPFTDAGKWDIPVLFDGVHFSEEGHRVFAEKMLQVFKKEDL